jgi:hypothetical protein
MPMGVSPASSKSITENKAARAATPGAIAPGTEQGAEACSALRGFTLCILKKQAATFFLPKTCGRRPLYGSAPQGAPLLHIAH